MKIRSLCLSCLCFLLNHFLKYMYTWFMKNNFLCNKTNFYYCSYNYPLGKTATAGWTDILTAKLFLGNLRATPATFENKFVERTLVSLHKMSFATLFFSYRNKIVVLSTAQTQEIVHISITEPKPVRISNDCGQRSNKTTKNYSTHQTPDERRAWNTFRQRLFWVDNPTTITSFLFGKQQCSSSKTNQLTPDTAESMAKLKIRLINLN